ncbi:CDP-alcohol phosphatidyltransferase family protein [Sphingomonas morindae]|uniref:CDP-alcohol phosphatidyltransferase family protein n=1 Tax=Sphingomonas morindae TaxID=1541170 RepID=A0ABY4XCF7_9SPHN|nr:CDP-alcohol phosphatidyltransferase family protein [Sphingomonas morindae]USI74637.1 CDP-alcohol phosphatidyltransferase family protein [Sphingomonas morindae]
MSNAERIRRMARAQAAVPPGPPGPGAAPAATLWADTHFAFDPEWFKHILAHPGAVLQAGGRPVLAHLPAGIDDPHAPGLTVIDYDARPTLYNHALRKRECPFVEPLTRQTAPEIERRSYYGAYKGATDLLTKYLWPEAAFALTRMAARAGLSPNMVTTIGSLLCIAATLLFARGDYWSGLALGFLFMVLDTVDGKLARCTITSSWWGNIFDHGLDLIHPPIWWLAWGLGTRATAHPLDDARLVAIMVAIMAAYAAQRLIEGLFIRAFGMHIHVWRRFDTWFRLFTARRNPNMAILFVALAAGRPDRGLEAVAWWSLLSLLVHAGQLLGAFAARRRGPLRSWLSEE